MITQVITNRVKPGAQRQYIAISKAFCKAMVERDGCLESNVFLDKDCDTNIVNVVKWNTVEEAEAFLQSDTCKEFFPQFHDLFEGNTTLVLEPV